MNPNEGGRSQGRRRPRAPGFSDFGADPFFGGGLMGGMMGSSSFFDNFFNRDPFDDPFFTRPMGGMGLGMGMLGPDLFGRGPLGLGMGMNTSSFRNQNGFFSGPDGSLLDQQPFRPSPPQPEVRRGPVIEELPDDADEEITDSKAQDTGHPIVEHPEDEEGPGAVPQQTAPVQLTRGFQTLSNQTQHQPSTGYGNHSNGTFQSFTFQSSSTSFGGSGGSFYSSSSMRRVGPDGVVQEEHVEKDSSGREARRSARGMRDQVHAITKKRNVSSGPESTVETLHNLTPEEVLHFDVQWEAQADRSLPGWNRGGRMQALEGHHLGSHRPAPPALRYNDESSVPHMARRRPFGS